MRCTRCDGLAVPQAVGIAPDGRVVFGWCLQCLADKKCRLVEVSTAGPWELKLSLPIGNPVKTPLPGGDDSVAAGDQARWVVAIIAFMMITWGLILLAAGLFSGPRSASLPSPLGNGTSPLLCTGGTVAALFGLALMVLGSRRNWLPGIFLLAVSSWSSLLAGVGILAYGLFESQPGRNLHIVLGAGVAMAISVTTRLLERCVKRNLRPQPLLKAWKWSAVVSKSSARQSKHPY